MIPRPVLLSLLVAWSAAAATPLTPAELRGRRIYREGTGSAAMTARIGDGEFGASLFPCATCHGADGRGVPEGSVEPADVRWSALAKILVPPDGRGRRRPRYDETSFARALQQGVDAGGNRLSPIMPRYRMDDADRADLAAYLKRLGDEPQPGVSDTTLHLTTLDPRARPVLEAFFADLNAGGGVHGRTMHLRDTDVFAIIGGAAPIRDEEIPFITPLPFDPPRPASFFLFSDVSSQAAALRTHFGAPTHILRRIEDWETLAAAAGHDDDLLLLLGPTVDAGAILRHLAPLPWRPRILVAGTSDPVALLDAGPSFRNRIFLAVPSLPSDVTPEAGRDLLAFLDRHRLPKTQLPATIATLAAARVFVEGLKRAGRELTREKLTASLETLYQFATGLTPPVSYARGRHAGSTGAYIVAVDVEGRTFVPVTGGWVAPRE
ncbi:MAG TPA: ABC transporter substrate-binding protein [Thermoanaerobaculia bacterium]|nr:ABC transporter substrate-binding protein [Thermoanaerobaculia bacterium]